MKKNPTISLDIFKVPYEIKEDIIVVPSPFEKFIMSKLTYSLITLIIFLTSGCSTKMGMFFSANINPLTPVELALSDGYVATFYKLQKGDANKTDSILFFVGGSGHASKNYYLRPYFEKLPGDVTIYALQKRFVEHRETGLLEPTEAFYQFNYYPQLVQDQKEFIHFILEKQDRLHEKVVIFGVSEGGIIAAQLAAEIPETTHLMMLGSGGMPVMDEFKLWGENRNIDFSQIHQACYEGSK